MRSETLPHETARPRPRPITVRPRPRPKKWSRDHAGLETLTSLVFRHNCDYCSLLWWTALSIKITVGYWKSLLAWTSESIGLSLPRDNVKALLSDNNSWLMQSISVRKICFIITVQLPLVRAVDRSVVGKSFLLSAVDGKCTQSANESCSTEWRVCACVSFLQKHCRGSGSVWRWVWHDGSGWRLIPEALGWSHQRSQRTWRISFTFHIRLCVIVRTTPVHDLHVAYW